MSLVQTVDNKTFLSIIRYKFPGGISREEFFYDLFNKSDDFKYAIVGRIVTDFPKYNDCITLSRDV
jgi:hypothetical protein